MQELWVNSNPSQALKRRLQKAQGWLLLWQALMTLDLAAQAPTQRSLHLAAYPRQAISMDWLDSVGMMSAVSPAGGGSSSPVAT